MNQISKNKQMYYFIWNIYKSIINIQLYFYLIQVKILLRWDQTIFRITICAVVFTIVSHFKWFIFFILSCAIFYSLDNYRNRWFKSIQEEEKKKRSPYRYLSCTVRNTNRFTFVLLALFRKQFLLYIWSLSSTMNEYLIRPT
jgi:hypothetical protein